MQNIKTSTTVKFTHVIMEQKDHTYEYEYNEAHATMKEMCVKFKTGHRNLNSIIAIFDWSQESIHYHTVRQLTSAHIKKKQKKKKPPSAVSLKFINWATKIHFSCTFQIQAMGSQWHPVIIWAENQLIQCEIWGSRDTLLSVGIYCFGGTCYLHLQSRRFP
jgi:hypothetical protein